MAGLLAAATNFSTTNLTPSAGALVASYLATVSGFVSPSVRVSGLNTTGRQTLTLAQVVNDATNDHPSERGSRIKGAATDSRVQFAGFPTWLNAGDTLKVYLASSSSSDTAVSGSVRFIDAINPTEAVATDAASRTASQADLAGLPTADAIIDLDTKALAIKTKTDTLPAMPAAAGDAMALTPATRATLVAEIEAEIVDDSTGEAVKQAIVNKIAADFPDLDELTVAAIAAATATASRDALVAVANTFKADVSTLASQASVNALGSPLQASGYTAPDNATIANAAASAASADTKLDQVTERTDRIPAQPAAVSDVSLTGDGLTQAQADQLAQIAAATAGSVEFRSPVSQDGETIELVVGDAYASADGRALTWTLTNTTFVVGSSVQLTLVDRQGEGSITAAGTLEASGSDTVLRFELTAEQTSTLELGTDRYGFDVQITTAGRPRTIIRGRATILEEWTP